MGKETFGAQTGIKVKVKVKLSLRFSSTEHHAMKAYWGSEGVAPLIF
jgi:hypothetical protein